MTPLNILAAFDQGQTPTIALINAARSPLGFSLEELTGALNTYLLRDFIPVWGTPCILKLVPGTKIPPADWAIVLVDNPDVAGALGYHDLTPAGFPLSKVFVKIGQRSGVPLSVTISHELVEMLVDPGAQLAALGPNNTFYAYETADPVQNESYFVDKFQMTNFVYPSWFEGFRTRGKFDHLGYLKKPFEITKGGYMPVFRRGKWTQIFGSKEAEREFKKKPYPRLGLRVTSEHQKSKVRG